MKISKKKILSFTGWVTLSVFVVLSISFVNKQKEAQRCLQLNIEVSDSTHRLFIDKSKIIKLIKDSNISIIGYPLTSINTLNVENIVKNYSPTKTVKTYCSIKGSINIEITQRKPIMRVINYSGESYYIDKDGIMMQLSDFYTARVIVVSGHINEPFESRRSINLNIKNEKQPIKRGETLKNIYKLVSYINKDKLWKSQFQQIYINSDNEYELTPIIGTQKIFFGKIDNYKIKLRNLKQFYKKGIHKRGWNTYKEINLKYNNQIVCTKN